MEKYLLLKLNMNISEIEKILEQKLILEQKRDKRGDIYFTYFDDINGIHINFTKEKNIESISFHPPFSLAVDGIKLGMDIKEVEKIKGLPERTSSFENDQGIEEWVYCSKNTFYLIVDKKVYEIQIDEYFKKYLSNDDIEKLINSVNNVDKIEDCDFKISSSFDIDNINK